LSNEDPINHIMTPTLEHLDIFDIPHTSIPHFTVSVRLHQLITFVKTIVIELNMVTKILATNLKCDIDVMLPDYIYYLIIVIYRESVPHPTESRYAHLQ
jgi:hypothetical protein